jgi:hypothetical protein
MADPQPTTRSWLVSLGPDDVRLRCSYVRVGKRVERFTVQLEVRQADAWHPVVRYDNAHGFCHRDTLHPNGTQEKTPVFFGDLNASFTMAIDELRTNWAAHRDRFLKEIGS